MGFWSICQELKYDMAKLKDNFKLMTVSNKTDENDVSCVLEEMNAYYLAKMKDCQVSKGTIFPITSKQWECFAEKHINNTEKKDFYMSQKNRPFDAALQWLNEESHTTGVVFREKHPYNVEAIRIKIVTSYVIRTMGMDLGIELFNNWDDYVEKKTRGITGLARGFAYSNFGEAIVQVQTIVRQGILGIAIGLVVAFIMVLIVTSSVPISIIMLLTIIPIVTCILAMIPLSGWKLGFLEGLNLCFVVGLAVDYTIHLAEAYNLSKFKGRHERLKDAVGHLGISILSGAITTGGAAFFMLFGQIQFFVQFGSFILAIVGFANLFTLTFQATLLGLFGPEDSSNCCDVPFLGKSIFGSNQVSPPLASLSCSPPPPYVEKFDGKIAESFDNKAFDEKF
jgi:hypothetical protein